MAYSALPVVNIHSLVYIETPDYSNCASSSHLRAAAPTHHFEIHSLQNPCNECLVVLIMIRIYLPASLAVHLEVNVQLTGLSRDAIPLTTAHLQRTAHLPLSVATSDSLMSRSLELNLLGSRLNRYAGLI